MAVEVNHSVYLPSVMKAIQEKLGSWERPVVTDYELAVLMTSQMAHLEEQPTLRFYEKVVESLGSFGLISPSKDFKPGTVYHLFGRAKPKGIETWFIAASRERVRCVRDARGDETWEFAAAALL